MKAVRITGTGGSGDCRGQRRDALYRWTITGAPGCAEIEAITSAVRGGLPARVSIMPPSRKPTTKMASMAGPSFLSPDAAVKLRNCLSAILRRRNPRRNL
jgi:hypothetical protein